MESENRIPRRTGHYELNAAGERVFRRPNPPRDRRVGIDRNYPRAGVSRPHIVRPPRRTPQEREASIPDVERPHGYPETMGFTLADFSPETGGANKPEVRSSESGVPSRKPNQNEKEA